MGNQKRNRIIMGSAIGLAALAVTIDHTRHALPEPSPKVEGELSYEELLGGNNKTGEAESSPCGLGGGSPCAM